MSSLMSAAAYMALPNAEPDHEFRYGGGDDQFGHLYLPPTPTTENKHPVVFLLHGGCWRHAFGLAPLGQMARALTRLGFAVCSLEYRRIDGAGGWPHTFVDVATGLEALGRLSESHPLDLTRVILSGHSAGGHLALWLAGRWRVPDGSEVHLARTVQPGAVVCLAGIGDLELALAQNVCGDAAALLVGGDPLRHPQRYAHASPRALLPLKVPQWHVVGQDDPLVPAAYVEQFVSRARAAGDTVELKRIAEVGHFEIVTASSALWGEVEAVYKDALDALERRLCA